MATDATGTPTPKGIPKFNTSVDAPSGLGSNAQMDAIDALLDSYIGKPAGIASGEVPVWNGSAFVRSSVTRISTVRPQDLGQDGANTNDFLKWNGSMWVPAPVVSNTQTLIQADFTAKSISNSTAETTMMNSTPSITGNSLGSIGAIHYRAWGFLQQGTTASMTWTYKLKLGATTIVNTGALGGGGATDSGGLWDFHIIIRNTGATNAQYIAMVSANDNVAQGRSPFDGHGAFAVTSAVDTTATQALDFTVQMNTAGASNTFRRDGHIVWIDTAGI